MSDTLLTFHGDPKIKAKYIKRVKAHQEADELVQNYGYWDGGKGCAVGCTLHSSDHNAFETELGIPEWIARCEDSLFEGMSEERSKTFPLEFLEAIPVGVELNKIKFPFLIMVLDRVLEKVDLKDFPAVETSIKKVKELLVNNGSDEEFDAASAVARAAASAAAGDAASYAASYAAYEFYADQLLKLMAECK